VALISANELGVGQDMILHRLFEVRFVGPLEVRKYRVEGIKRFALKMLRTGNFGQNS
jgi:hypothetical protein